MLVLPTGTVTFLFTDVEGSTRLWEADPARAGQAMARHDELIDELVQKHSGVLVRPRGEGDSRFAVFTRPADAVAAACAIQCALGAERWPTPEPIRVRMALHTGAAELREGDYYGADVNRCARLRAIAHGGQTLLSGRTAELTREALPRRVTLHGLGQHRLKDLGQPERVYQLLHPDLPTVFPPLKSFSSMLSNLPVQPTVLVGRESELTQLRRLLGTTRLLTLTGTGGAGKTRLALHVAADVLDDFEDGVWLVELAPLADWALVVQAVAAVLAVREEPSRLLLDSVLDALRPKQTLLLLDNCEHLVHACAQFADRVLRACPNVRLLATSREALSIAGETAWQVPSLSLPDRRSPHSLEQVRKTEATRLFIERATAVRPNLVLTDRDAPAVIDICRRLDGIPLAIELAAARVRLLGIGQIAERLEDRFRLLTGGSRVAPSRQQTLQAAIDWSHDLLAESERTVFARLSVFAGGLDIEAAEAVCQGGGIVADDVLDLLAQLVEKSLVLAETASRQRTRYHLLETLRHYARARLAQRGETESVSRLHAAHYLALAERAAPQLAGPEQALWLERLEQEHDNLRTALSWSVESGETELGLRMGGELSRFWARRGYLSEGREAMAKLINAPIARPAPEEAIPIRAKALHVAGTLAVEQGDFATAQVYLEQSLEMQRALGDTRQVANTLNNIAQMVAHASSDFGAAQKLLEESLELRRASGDQTGIAQCLNNLGVVARGLGNYADARGFLEESLAISRQTRNRWSVANSITGLAEVALETGDNAAARPLLQESLKISLELDDPSLLAFVLENLGVLAAATLDPIRALRLAGAATALREQMAMPRTPVVQTRLNRFLQPARQALEEEAAREAWVEGQAMSREQAVAYALAAPDLG